MNWLDELLEGAETIAIGGHVRPDGDCVGSCLGLKNYILENYPVKSVEVFMEEPPSVFAYLKGFEDICSDFTTDNHYDIFFALDCGDTGRLGDAYGIFENAGKTVCIDHHISNTGYADMNRIDGEIGSTCEILFYLMEADKISQETASAIYTGIIHDTGVLKYSNTTSKTLQAVGVLIDKGVPFTKIIDDTFYTKTYVQKQILGRALLESILLFDGKCIASVIRKRDMEFYNVTSKDMEGIVSELLTTEGVEVSIFLYEMEFQTFKVSLRSKELVDVSTIASYFGGGGHIRAAGCTMEGSPHDVINNLTLHIEKQFLEHQQ